MQLLFKFPPRRAGASAGKACTINCVLVADGAISCTLHMCVSHIPRKEDCCFTLRCTLACWMGVGGGIGGGACVYTEQCCCCRTAVTCRGAGGASSVTKMTSLCIEVMVPCWQTCSHGKFTMGWCTSIRTLVCNVGTESQVLNFCPIIGQHPCRNFLSSQRVLETETQFSSICLPSGCKPMARISAVTALRSHATFLRGVMGAAYASRASGSLAGRLVTRSLRRGALSVAIRPCDASNVLPANMASLSRTTTVTTPGATHVGIAPVESKTRLRTPQKHIEQ